ncbi:DUF3302 domain-containing protein [Pelagicoccus mobilis]|uniref:DUF3302 domain-containing protein n=1 Tax=Pelagicoccus mobilis TaxID=415221 RepID=A0A934S1H5_9BACT|nr:DUF3302 domain-containing protein [Pelagicoccus mobilis]MBK1879299.1 DUF3302 domain-containing protein [Pelagicoccus mobilis]
MLNIFALILVLFVVLFFFYAIIVIHDIPYEMAKKRNHPHAEAIHYGGWVSLFTLHAIWPFLWIWATLYNKETGWGSKKSNTSSSPSPNQELLAKIDALVEKVDHLESQLATVKESNKES